MVKSKIMTVLEAVASGAVDFASIVSALATTPYGSSLSELTKRINEATENRYHGPGSLPEKQKRNLKKIIYKLKSDGLIEVSDKRLKLTVKGKNKLTDQASRLPDKNYERAKDDGFKIIAFDIPEKQRGKRAWLRDVLMNLGFKMFQRSVWYGKAGIPKQFINDLRKMGILEHVDILAVTKTGTAKIFK